VSELVRDHWISEAVSGRTYADWRLFGNGVTHRLGVNYQIDSDWALDDYGAWWQSFTRDYVAVATASGEPALS
jgi:hypothetical protein